MSKIIVGLLIWVIITSLVFIVGSSVYAVVTGANGIAGALCAFAAWLATILFVAILWVLGDIVEQHKP